MNSPGGWLPPAAKRRVTLSNASLRELSKGIVMFHLCNGIICMALLAAAFLPQSSLALESKYDPLAVSTEELPKPIDITVKDHDRDDREVPLRIYLPATK